MTDKEKALLKDYIIKDEWYKEYVKLLIKAAGLNADQVKLLAQVSKPDISDEQMEAAIQTYLAGDSTPTKNPSLE